MSAELSEPKSKSTRRLKWLLLGGAIFATAFLFGPAAIRATYSAFTDTADVELLKQRYRALDTAESSLPEVQRLASATRRIEISRWLEMRGIAIDPGIRDEGVEHTPFPIALFGIKCWAWTDIGRYWSLPSAQRTPRYLLSDVHSD